MIKGWESFRWRKREQGSRTPRLVGEADADFVGYFQCVFYAGADGGAVEVVAGKMEAGEVGAHFFDGLHAGNVAKIVLRKGARPDGDIRKDGAISNRKQGSNFPVD